MSSSSGAVIDWADVRRRVDRLADLLSGEEEMSADGRRDVLRARARALARPAAETEREEIVDLVEIRFAEEALALEARYVLGIQPLGSLGRLPPGHGVLIGVSSWRGGLLKVVDLRRLLGIAGGSASESEWLLIVAIDGQTFGVLSDALPIIRSLPRSTLRPAAGTLGSIGPLLAHLAPGGTLVLDAKELGRTFTRGIT